MFKLSHVPFGKNSTVQAASADQAFRFDSPSSQPGREATASPLWVGLLCGLAAGLAMVWMVQFSEFTALHITLLSCLAYALPGLVFEYGRAHGWALPTVRQGSTWQRALILSAVKTLGLVQILVLAGVLYSILPEYEKGLYSIWQAVYVKGALCLTILAPFYFLLCEITLGPRYDVYRYIGRYSLLTYLLRVWRRPVLRQPGLMWIVKLFFLPIMLGSLHFSVTYFTSNMPIIGWSNFYRFFDVAWEMILALDVTLAVIGYLCSLRLFNTSVASTDPTWRGWVATLICYSPFSTVLYGSYLTYEDGLRWGDMLRDYPLIYICYGSLLLVLHVLYLTASLNFGIRYSNLSHRGLITDGLFRLTRHPAYLFKNIVWWMISLPFISNMGAGAAVANCGLLLCVNAVYWWRARTEEMHLSRDPEYVAYALKMNDQSIMALVGKTLPAFAYRPPEAHLRGEYRLRGPSAPA
jgi:protein-S-isoprenylcysteine O-methyltransferase Ste14